MLFVNDSIDIIGGAGNVANNLKKLGAQVDIISVIGHCKVSIELTNLLSDLGISTENLIMQKNRISSKKTRIISSHQQVVRYDRESSDDIDITSQNLIVKKFEKIIDCYDIVLLSDYGKGVLTNQLTQNLIKIAKKHGKKVLVDPKGKDYSKYKDAFLLTPNKKEASDATQVDILDNDSLNKAIIALKSLCNLEFSLITLRVHSRNLLVGGLAARRAG